MTRASCLAILFLLAGCGGGGGGHDPAAIPSTGSSPTITGMEVFLISDPGTSRTSFTEGDTISGYVHATDTDMDMAYLHALEYYPATATEPYSEQLDWDLSEQTHVSMAYLPLDAMEVAGPVGTWRIDFQAEDLAGHLSNIYSFVYDVSAPEEDPGPGEPPILPIPVITQDHIEAGGTSESIILSWDVSYDYWLAYYEIFRASVNDVDLAVSIGSTTARVYADHVGPARTYYYWIRIAQVTEAGGGVGELPEEGKQASSVAMP